jgi:predicted DNA-binding ribbon-helix-helix protein
MPGKRVQFDDETWLALDVLARDRMMSFQELADEAFRDLLEKHHRPTSLKSALKQSAARHVGDPPTKTTQTKRTKPGS